MKEFDPNKSHSILGCNNVEYLFQDGRRYLPKRNKPPQVLLSGMTYKGESPGGVHKTKAGGKLFKCQFCEIEFDHQVKLSKHYKESWDCMVKKRREKTNKVIVNRINQGIYYSGGRS